MRRGPRPKPIATHRLEGTYDASRHARRAIEPQAPGSLADIRPPPWMTRRQKAIWAEALKDAPVAVLGRIDRFLFQRWVVLADAWEKAAIAQNKVDENASAPLLSRAGPVVQASPYLGIMNRTALVMGRLEAELGFTPSARASLGVPGGGFADSEPANVHERFDVVLPNGQVIPYAGRK
jgi:phage terminase small subunit